MEHEAKLFTVLDIVAAWKAGDLSRNDEYQRGARWTLEQKQGLIDSVFRKYPIPPLFLHRVIRRAPMSGNVTTRFEVVDGQQRIRALLEFMDDKFALLLANDRKLRLPSSMRERSAPWGGRRFKDLHDDLRKSFENTSVPCYLLDAPENDDEVRDLFIRLQAGTALGRQQIRDAWPGRVGPFVTRLAGKMERKPISGLFSAVDLRGARGDDEGERDEYVADRQTCAQLLRIFMMRESDPAAAPSVSAGDLDALYHENPEFNEGGATAVRFVSCLEYADQVLRRAIELHRATSARRNKFRKLEVIAVVSLFQDLTRNPSFKVTTGGIMNLAKSIVSSERSGEPGGRNTSGRAIAGYYEWWRGHVVVDPGVRIDPTRCFPDELKRQIWSRDGGACGVCCEPVHVGDEEYDHFPIPYRDGGKTEVANGRLVHARCHPRGRPLAE